MMIIIMTKIIRKRNADDMRGKGRSEEGIWKEQKWDYGKKKAVLFSDRKRAILKKIISLFFSVASGDCRYI
jgi:hypothetical protein